MKVTKENIRGGMDIIFLKMSDTERQIVENDRGFLQEFVKDMMYTLPSNSVADVNIFTK